MQEQLSKSDNFNLGRAESSIQALSEWVDSLQGDTHAEVLRIVQDKVEQLRRKIAYFQLLENIKPTINN